MLELKKIAKAFCDDYKYYRRSQMLVRGQGRWESFRRALEWHNNRQRLKKRER